MPSQLNQSSSGHSRPSLTLALRAFWRRATRVERIGYAVGGLLVTSGLVHAAVLIASGGSWNGPVSLRKPTTFGLSFGLTLITIVWTSTFVSLGRRTRTILLATFTGACALETTLVSLQAWRGVPSHFNVATPFDALVTRGLAFGGLSLVVVVAMLTWASFRANPGVPASLRLATRVGFAALLGAQLVGAVMIARGMTLVFGGEANVAYATGGALKPMHAVTMHGVLVLPALAWLSAFATWSERRRTRIVAAAAIGYGLMIAAVTIANITQHGWTDMPAAMLASFTVGAIMLCAAAGVVFAAVVRTPARHAVAQQPQRVATGAAATTGGAQGRTSTRAP
jgi:hypothetical protein